MRSYDDITMTQVLTISCKLKVSQSQAAKLDETLDALSLRDANANGQALNWVNQNTPEKVVNPLKLQSLCYYEIRARFGLSSNLARTTSRLRDQQICRRVASARKVAQQKNRPVKALSLRDANANKGGFATYDARIFSFREKDWTVSLSLRDANANTMVEGRERFELAIGHYQREQLAGSNPKKTSGPLTRLKASLLTRQPLQQFSASAPGTAGALTGFLLEYRSQLGITVSYFAQLLSIPVVPL